MENNLHQINVLLLLNLFRLQLLNNNCKWKFWIKVLLNKILGAIGALLISFALSRGPATLVNALQGLQYAFVFILAAILYIFLPGVVRENFGKKAIIQKVSGMILVSVGLFFLTYFNGAL